MDSRLLCCGHGLHTWEACVQQNCYPPWFVRESWTKVMTPVRAWSFDRLQRRTWAIHSEKNWSCNTEQFKGLTLCKIYMWRQLVCFEWIRFCMIVLVPRFAICWFDDVKSYSYCHDGTSVFSCVPKRIVIIFFWHILSVVLPTIMVLLKSGLVTWHSFARGVAFMRGKQSTSS